MTKRSDADKADAIAKLRDWIKPGDTVYTVLDHVSASGMSRAIRVVLIDKTGAMLHPNYAVGKALDLRHWKRNGYEQAALVIGGLRFTSELWEASMAASRRFRSSSAGMDMGFHLVNNLSFVMYPTYQCIGKRRKCPSNMHVNSGPDRDKYGARITHTDSYAIRQRWI